MIADRLKIEFDYAQQRVSKHAISVIALASYESRVPGIDRAPGFDPALSSSDFWQDPVSYTGMLKPNIIKAEWNTTFTGIYARYRKTDFTFTTSAKWTEPINGGSGDYWLQADNLTADEWALTNDTYAINQPMIVNWFKSNPDSQRFIELECGWGDSASMATGVALRFYSDGDVEVWKTTLVGSYKISGSNSGDTKGNQFTGVLLIPGRKRDLLVIGLSGKGFVHTFTDLDESGSEPTVTPATKFWVKAPYQSSTRSLKCQVAKMQFPSSGYGISNLLAFPEPPTPEQGAVQFDTWGDNYGGTISPSLKDSGGSSSFVANGTNIACRVRGDLTGDGSRTPFLYASKATFFGITANTSDEPDDVMSHVTEASLTVGETAESASFGIVLARLDTLSEVYQDQSNRPVRIGYTDGPLVMGARSETPDWEDSSDETNTTARIVCRDRWKGLETNLYRDVIPLDELTLDEALRRLTAPVIGVDATRYDIDAEALTFTIPSNSSATTGEWTQLVEVGDKSSQWVDRLMDCYAPDWVYGFRPLFDRTVFYAKSVASLGTTSALEVYDNWQQAFDSYVSDGYDEREARKLTQGRCFRTFRQKPIEPEATDVHVTGWDPRTSKPIHVYKVDHDAEDPTIARDDRPDNWLGEKRVYGWCDTGINSLALAQRCCEKLFNRLTVKRRMAEWTSGLLFNPDGSLVWRGDNVKLVRNGVPYVYRVTSVRCTFMKERDTLAPGMDGDYDTFGEWFWREATYTGELINEDRDAWRGSSPGTSLEEIVAHSKLRLLNDPVRASRGSEFLLKRIPETRTLVA